MSGRAWVVSGCLVLLGALAALGLLIGSNWDQISSLARHAKANLEELHVVQQSLAQRYGGQIGVQMTGEVGAEASTLYIRIVNSPELQGLSKQEAEDLAREVAAHARAALRSDRYEHYLVALLLEVSRGVSLASGHEFRFKRDDVPVITHLVRGRLPIAGTFYSVDNGDGGFRIVEILEPESNGAVSARLYGNRFSTRPRTIDPAALTMAPSSGFEGPGIDRVEVSPAMWAVWRPRRLSAAPDASSASVSRLGEH